MIYPPHLDKSTLLKAKALLARMNLEQKIGQMILAERTYVSPTDVRNYHLGGVLSCGGSNPGNNQPADWISMNDAFWAASMDEDDLHLAIPLLYGVDAIHGHAQVCGATIFPHNIGLGAAHDPGLVRRVAEATAREVLATGIDWTFAPNLAVARHIAWGRTYESFSEDTAVVSAYAAPFIEGLQGDLGEDAVIACAKHWVGDGGTDYGVNQGDARMAEDELRRLHIAPYREAIEAGVLTVMVSFNSWNGDKCHGNRYLVNGILKEELQFRGFVLSDWDGIDYLSEDYHNAVALAVNAGIDMFMVSEQWRDFASHLKRHVNRGSVPLKRIDDAVLRILQVKYAFDLFDKPRPSLRACTNHADYGSEKHRKLAREAVRKSLVLLKNNNGFLPLNKKKRILVAGRNAHDRGNQCGGFSLTWQGNPGNRHVEGATSIWEGIQQIVPHAVLSADTHGNDADPDIHDCAIVVIGETSYAEGLGDIRSGDHVIVEAGSQIRGSMDVLEPYGKTLELCSLHPEDLRTIETVTSKGVPLVVVLISGRPLVVNRELALSEAFVAAWLPGSEGRGVADVLFGDFDFQGKLAFSWPAGNGHVPAVWHGNRDVLFPRGFGLTYRESSDTQSLVSKSA